MTHNQTVLARMMAISAIEKSRQGRPQPPMGLVMAALEDAINDARGRRNSLEAAGGAGSSAYLQLNAQIARWESARRSNR